MGRREDLERSIRESYDIVRQYEAILQTSDRPEEKLRARREIERQWMLIEGQVRELAPLSGGALPPDLAELAARFAPAASSMPPPASSLALANPFGDAGRITDPARFFDREELLRQVYEELGKGVSVSLVGEAQVGKSSVLSMVCVLGRARIDPPPERVAYLSLEWVRDEDDFYRALCEALGLDEPCRGWSLNRALRGRRCVLCLDEAEKMAWAGFSAHVRSELRGLADGPAAPLKLVVASRSSLERLFPDSPELDSPLAGICRPLEVGPFSPAVARAFLERRLQGSGIAFAEQEVTALLAESGGHPARLQRAGADLYRQRARGVRGAPLSGAPLSGAPLSGALYNGVPLSGAPEAGASAPAAVPAQGAPEPNSYTAETMPDLLALRRALLARCGLRDLRDLCLAMGIDDENYTPTKADFVRELLRDLERQGRVEALVRALRQEKPWVLR
jgi:hypothetical protein